MRVRSLALVLLLMVTSAALAKTPTLVTTSSDAATATSTSTAPPPAVSTEERHADHEELRGMLKTATEALNARNVDALAPLMASRCYITTVDGHVLNDLAGFRGYIDQVYGTKIQKIEFHPVADELTMFLGSDAGVCRGSSTDVYTFKDGDIRTMTSRWTATVHKEGGHWKLVALHTGASILDNPVLAAVRKHAYTIATIALIAGIILGYLIRMMVKRV
jgi:ketosteroid isomerase-like protein